jgi:hypothetical protein
MVFHVFVLMSTLIVTSLGPAGTQFGVMEYKAKEFQTVEKCQSYVDSGAFAPDKESAKAMVEGQLKEEFKGSLKYDFVCSDKTMEELKVKETDS